MAVGDAEELVETLPGGEEAGLIAEVSASYWDVSPLQASGLVRVDPGVRVWL